MKVFGFYDRLCGAWVCIAAGVLAAAANHFRGGDVAAATVSASIAVEVCGELTVFSGPEAEYIINDWIHEKDDSPLESP